MAPSALAVRRITIDVKRIMELTDSGLFWIHDETDITHGWAVVCAYDGTPYYGGAFCFDVRFPDTYPFDPPVFNYLTNDGRTRFNPNLYKNGKVCLSLLNTWQGEQWSGVQSLTSILQSIQTAVLNQDPLQNEPAYSAQSMHTDIPIYNRMIFHATLETAILAQLTEPPDYLVAVYEAVKAWSLKARSVLVEKARALAAEWDNKKEYISFYSMTQKYRFAELADKLMLL
jgi:ubiquitin-conjugating enzyme E2 Z